MNDSDQHLGKSPIIICECGQMILVVPDLQEMVCCIRAHATIHAQKQANCTEAKAEYERIEQLLTQRAILAIANMTKKQ